MARNRETATFPETPLPLCGALGSPVLARPTPLVSKKARTSPPISSPPWNPCTLPLRARERRTTREGSSSRVRATPLLARVRRAGRLCVVSSPPHKSNKNRRGDPSWGVCFCAPLLSAAAELTVCPGRVVVPLACRGPLLRAESVIARGSTPHGPGPGWPMGRRAHAQHTRSALSMHHGGRPLLASRPHRMAAAHRGTAWPPVAAWSARAFPSLLRPLSAACPPPP